MSFLNSTNLKADFSNKKIAFIGYSGHSYLCVEIALFENLEIVGYYDFEEKSTNPYQLTYLGIEEEIVEDLYLFPSIGNNSIREKLFRKNKNSFKLNLIHHSAQLSPNVDLGFANLVSCGSIINPMVSIGNATIINSGSIVEHECVIGDFSHICPGTVLCGNVSVGNNCFIGANSVLKEGIQICDNVTIGAGSVVVKSIIEPGVYVGNPAKKLVKN